MTNQTTTTTKPAETSPEIAEFEETHFDQPEGPTISLTVIAQGTWLMAKIVVPLLIGCFAVTLIYASVKAAIVATFTVFMLSIFIAIPLFLACVEDEIGEPEYH